MPVEFNPSASSRSRASPTPGRQHRRDLHIPNTVKQPSPLAHQVVVEDDDESEQTVEHASHGAMATYSDEEVSTISDDDDFFPDAVYPQLTQDDTASQSPPPSSATSVRTVDYYLKRSSPLLVLLMDKDDAKGMLQACRREGHKAALENVSGGQAIVKYAKKPKTYREVGSYIRIRVVWSIERRISKMATSIRRTSRSMLPLLSNPWFWVVVLVAGIVGACIVSISLCIALDICVDIVSTPTRFLMELLLLILGCLLYIGGCLFYAAQLIIQRARGIVELINANATVVNKRAHLGAQSLIRSAVTFLEGCIDEDL